MNKVFGIGLSKTGTKSLAAALNLLGVRTIHYPSDPVTLAELKRGDFALSFLRTYQGATDVTMAPYFAQLDVLYPGSKFILTVRERGPWLASLENHFANPANYDYEFARFILTAVYGCQTYCRDRFEYVYEAHALCVEHYFKDRPADLLTLDLCGGDQPWSRLCGFLGLPVPSPPFPHENRRGGS